MGSVVYMLCVSQSRHDVVETSLWNSSYGKAEEKSRSSIAKTSELLLSLYLLEN
jgi:hypothetical protein